MVLPLTYRELICNTELSERMTLHKFIIIQYLLQNKKGHLLERRPFLFL